MQFPCTPAFSSSRPRLKRLRDDADGELGAGTFARVSTSSIASIAPSPRTSPICGQRACQRVHARADRLADRRRALDEPLVLDHVEHGERRRLRDRVADVRAADAALRRARP